MPACVVSLIDRLVHRCEIVAIASRTGLRPAAIQEKAAVVPLHWQG
jgi:hypothetical protein